MNLNLPEIETVLFDLDGTLIDSFEAYYQICKYGCEMINLPVPERIKVYPVMNEGISFFDLFFPHNLSNRKSLINTFLNETRRVRSELWKNYVRLMPGAEPLIKTIHKDYKLAVVTSSNIEALQPLERSGLISYFQIIVAKNDVRRQKPHPEGIRKALQHLKSESKTAVMVGDTPMDIMAGRDAGTLTAGVLSSTANSDLLKHHNPDLMFSSLLDFGAWLNLDASRQTLSASSVQLQGKFTQGIHQASEFLTMEWVSQRINSITGFTPFPGTFNLNLYPSSINRLDIFRQLYDHISYTFGPHSGYCDAVLYPCKVQTPIAVADAFVIFPMVPDYPQYKMEVISPVSLVNQLRAESGMDVQVLLYI